MAIDDALVFNAELSGLRRLAMLPRPKVRIVSEEIPGALCLWERGSADGGQRDDVRLVPDSGVPLAEVLSAVRESTVRTPGGHLQIRAVATSFDPITVSLLESLGARRDTAGPHAMMAIELRSFDAGFESGSKLTVTVATDAAGLAQLRSVVRQVYMGWNASESTEANDDADFFHAPGTMTYLAVCENEQAISTGSILIVDGVANIWSVATLPTARGRGAASAITRAACAEAGRQGASVAALRTSAELAEKDGLYERIGFSVVGQEHAWNLDNVD